MNIPPRDEMVRAVQEHVPEELLRQPIWLAYYFKENKNGTLDKPPCRGYSASPDKPSFTFDKVIKDGYPGIKIGPSNSLVAVDIDDKEAKLGKVPFSLNRIPEPFMEYLIKSGTYTEMSPSGCGVRAIFRCDDKTDLPGRVNLAKDLCLGGELFMNSGFVTMTGDKLFGTAIANITKEKLSSWYDSNGHKPVVNQPVDATTLFSHPKVREVLDALKCCRLDQSSVMRQAYKTVTGQDYSHYDYWIKIMSACHHYITITGKHENEILSAVLDWSRTDEEFQSDDDVITHWSSFTEKPGSNNVTYNTLFKFAKLTRFNWPKEKFTKKGNPTGKPRVTEYVNFEYLVGYYGITILHEPYTNSLYISGDNIVIEKYFSGEKFTNFFGKRGPFDLDTLVAGLWRMSQDNHYDNTPLSSISQIAKSYIAFNTGTFNLMETWLNTPYDDLPEELKEPNTDPEKSNVDYLMSCIEYDDSTNMDLVKEYFKAFFSGIVMPLYNTDRLYPEHNFMLILTGPENCRKTTFLSSLLPEVLKRYLITHSTETLSSSKSLRDFLIQLSSSAILIIDEFEIFYSKDNDSLFKTLVTSSTVDYTPIYSKVLKKTDRTAALAGTTNKKQLPIEQDSNRRLALISVKWIDTDKMRSINWHKFYNDIIADGREKIAKHQYPWKLSQDIINTQYDSNEQFRSHTDLEITLREVFNFDHEFPGLHHINSVQTPNEEHTGKILYTLKEVKGVLLNSDPRLGIKPSAIKNVLKRLCGKYTKTTNLTRELPCCSGEVKNGVAKQQHYKKYIMPPRIEDTNFKPEEK